MKLDGSAPPVELELLDELLEELELLELELDEFELDELAFPGDCVAPQPARIPRLASAKKALYPVGDFIG